METAVFIAVITFWLSDGSLGKEVSRPMPTLIECERRLPHDVAARRKVYGNAAGECMASPPRPPGLPEPGPKKGPTA